jgi:UDPglucose--hexose-1-phosphate uridylyltransferase
MSEEHLALLLSTYRSRMEQLYHSNDRLKYVLLFKNFGPAAGASIGHTHSQIIAMPVVPTMFRLKSEAARPITESTSRASAA